MRTFLCFLFLLISPNAFALNVGEIAPDFTAPSTNGQNIKLSDLRGSWVVLFFYPKAFTPGCTSEACSLRDGYKALKKQGAVLLGVSLDDLETQKKFKAEYKLPYELISDHDKAISKSYDTLAFMRLFAERKTFLIDPQGKIAHIFENVETDDHTTQVLKELKILQTKK